MTDLATMTADELRALVTKLQSDQRERDAAKITLKIGEKGTVCLYHGSRYPIALYAEQWERLLPFLRSDALPTFISANSDKLARRDA